MAREDDLLVAVESRGAGKDVVTEKREEARMTKEISADQMARILRAAIEKYVEACKHEGPGMQLEQWKRYEDVEHLLDSLKKRGGTYRV